MSLEIVQQVAAEAPQLGLRSVLLSGGEAMQHPEWATAAQIMSDAGAYIMLLTNGLLLQRQADRVARVVDEVIVSLDAGTPETYQKVRGVDGLSLVLHGIAALRQRGVPVITRTTVQRDNYQEIPRIIEVAQDAGATRVSFLAADVTSPDAFGTRAIGQDMSPLALDRAEIVHLAAILSGLEDRFAAEFGTGFIAESPAKLRKLVTHFEALIGDAEPVRPRCNAPHFSVVIEVDGRLRPCYFLPSWGRLDGRNVLTAVNEPAAQSLREAYRAGKRHECDGCVCPLYKGLRGLLRM